MDLFVNQGTFVMCCKWTFRPCGLAANPKWKPAAVIVEVKAREWTFPMARTKQFSEVGS